MSNFKQAFLKAANDVVRDRAVPPREADHGKFLEATVNRIHAGLVEHFPHSETNAEINGNSLVIKSDEDALKKDDTFAVQYEIRSDGTARYSRSYDFAG